MKREIHCEPRFCKVALPATIKEAEPVPVSAVYLIERNPPGDEDPIQWFLLTSVDIDDAATAAKMIGYFLQRWRVEAFFRCSSQAAEASS